MARQRKKISVSNALTDSVWRAKEAEHIATMQSGNLAATLFLANSLWPWRFWFRVKCLNNYQIIRSCHLEQSVLFKNNYDPLTFSLSIGQQLCPKPWHSHEPQLFVVCSNTGQCQIVNVYISNALLECTLCGCVALSSYLFLLEKLQQGFTTSHSRITSTQYTIFVMWCLNWDWYRNARV